MLDVSLDRKLILDAKTALGELKVYKDAVAAEYKAKAADICEAARAILEDKDLFAIVKNYGELYLMRNEDFLNFSQ